MTTTQEPSITHAVLQDKTVLSVLDLRTYLHTRVGPARAVDGVSFDIRERETFALVGESGCGKSMTALSILRLTPEHAAFHPSGSIFLRGVHDAAGQPLDLLNLPEARLQEIRGSHIAMIFQEPMTALNPVQPVGEQVREALLLHTGLPRSRARADAIEALRRVGIPDPEEAYHAYPHQLSGGMRQRVMIAAALACRPSLLIADEPTTALDVTIQAQILVLIDELQRSSNAAVLLITHNLAIVYEHADRVAVMYAGQIVESGSRDDLFGDIDKAERHHPYTFALMRAVPDRLRRGQPLTELPGTVPPATNYPTGCRFASRCALTRSLARNAPREKTVAIDTEEGHVPAMRLCCQVEPELLPMRNEHRIACHFRRSAREVPR